ncbi:MAG TPA: S24 family peptidase [Anaerolineae bacterium]|nr:S24 family peptidase [Anaerolineae bacterium]
MVRRNEIEQQIALKQRRLQKLKEQKSIYGYSADPTIDLEIEELTEDIENLNAELRKLGLEGTKIIELLEGGLDEQIVLTSYQGLYRQARELMLRNPKISAETCHNTLSIIAKELTPDRLVNSLSGETADIDTAKYIKGKFNLLLGAIYLNEGDIKPALENFLDSKNEFSARGWPQLRALTSLGCATAYRKFSDKREATYAIENAENLLTNIPDRIKNRADLERAIREEKERIAELPESQPPPPPEPPSINVFDITTGEKIIAEKAMADLNFLGLKDYDNFQQRSAKTLGADKDLEKFARRLGIEFRKISYALDIPPKVESDGSLHPGDRLLIAEEKDPEKLNNKQVAILRAEETDSEVKLQVALMTFFQAARDHYFLRAKDDNGESIIILRYGSEIETIASYYEKYKRGGQIKQKVAYDIRVSGEVIGIVRQGTMFNPYDKGEEQVGKEISSDAIIFKLPIINNLEAVKDGRLTVNEIEQYLYLTAVERGKANFGIQITDNDMQDEGISSGDIALIYMQAEVENGEIAALLIVETEQETLGVLKRYFVEEPDFPKSNHWRLKSSNPLSADLIVIPPTSDANAIRAYYDRKERETPNKPFPDFYLEAEVVIVGKFVGVHRKS